MPPRLCSRGRGDSLSSPRGWGAQAPGRGPSVGGSRGRPLWSAWEPALPLLGVQRRARPGQLCTRPRQRRPPGRSVGTARRPSGDTQLIGRAAHPPGQNCLRAAARHATAREPRGRSRSRQVAYGSPRARRPGQTRAGSGLAGAGQRPPCARGPPGRRRSAAAGQPHGPHVLTVGRCHSELRGARSLGQRPRAEPSFGPRWVSTGTPGARLCGLEQGLWGQEPVCQGAWQRQGRLAGPQGPGAERVLGCRCGAPRGRMRRACTRPTRSRLTLHGRSPSAAGRAGVPVLARGRAPSPRASTAPRQRPPEPRRARRQARQGGGGGGSRTGPRAPRGPPPPARPGPHHPGLARRGLERRVASLALLLVPLVAVGLRRGLREVVAVLGCWGWAAGGKWLQAFPGLTPPGLTPPGPQPACPSPLGT